MASRYLRDVFISHASEDKLLVARPLAEALTRRKHTVWFDEHGLTIGDSLTPGIMEGLNNSQFGVLILSLIYFRKEWTTRELEALTERETRTGGKLILPIWHGLEYQDVRHLAPNLADRLAANTSQGIEGVANELSQTMKVWNEHADIFPPAPAPLLADPGALAQVASAMEKEDVDFAYISNILKVRHDTVKQLIANIE
jgi:hypothetical protein